MIADDLRLSFYKGPRGGVGTRPKLIFEQGMRGLSPPPPFLEPRNAPQPAKGRSPSPRPWVSIYQRSMSRRNNLGSKMQISGPTSSPPPPPLTRGLWSRDHFRRPWGRSSCHTLRISAQVTRPRGALGPPAAATPRAKETRGLINKNQTSITPGPDLIKTYIYVF